MENCAPVNYPEFAAVTLKKSSGNILYKNREQSLVKHQFLIQYIQGAAFKTLQGYSNTFNYVDAFAGPWHLSDMDAFSDASFTQAIKMLEDVKKELVRIGGKEPRIRFILCEKRAESVALLLQYAEDHKELEIHVFQGEFEQNLPAISKAIPDGFTFTFIDPTGWKIRNREIFSFLRARKGDFLLNFMSDHINRHAEYSGVTESIGHFVADPDWASEFDALSSTLSNEERILCLLKKKVKQEKVAIYCPDFSIFVPRKERIKMRLILGTNSAKGLEVFRDVQAKVELAQAEIRNEIKLELSPEGNLFEATELAKISVEKTGVGGRESLKSATTLLQSMLRSRGPTRFEILMPNILEEVPIRVVQLKDLLIELRARGAISFELPLRKKKPQPDTLISFRSA